MSQVRTGLDHLLAEPEKFLKDKSIGLVVNQTSVTGDLRHSIPQFKESAQLTLQKIFAPEHGLYGVEQDMIQVSDSVDPVSGTEVRSLYGDEEQSLAPESVRLQGIGHLIFDIQDVGSRYYTFIYTLANCMTACKEASINMIVCDRPNPLNGIAMEGNTVADPFFSFVGQYPVPNRHGMTVGELARLFDDHFGIGCDLTVVPMSGWNRSMWFDDTGLPWVPPSPNMPALSTATVYPGMCLIEGTRLSEGRGTTLPFEQIGAPFIDPQKLSESLQAENLSGIIFRPHYFKPTFHKWSQETCGGIQLHVTDRHRLEPFLTGIAVIRAIYNLYPDDFAWRTEPYEFVSDRPAIDLLYGSDHFRENLLPEGRTLKEIKDTWKEDCEGFEKLRNKFFLY